MVAVIKQLHCIWLEKCVFIVLSAILFGLTAGQEVKNACNNIIPLTNVRKDQTLILEVMNKTSPHHIDIHLEKIDIRGQCAQVWVGPGKDPSIDVGAFFTNKGSGQKIRVAQAFAFIRISQPEGGDITIRSECPRQVIPAYELTVIPTKYVPMEKDVTEETCFGRMDNETLYYFLQGNSSIQRRLEEKVKNETSKRLEENPNYCMDSLVARVVWPVFINNDCLPPKNATSWDCVCFRVSVKVTRNDTKCIVTRDILRSALKQVGSVVAENLSSVKISVVEVKTDTFIYIASSLGLIGITCVIFFIIWYYNEKHLRKQQKISIPRRASLTTPPVTMWPPVQTNPLYPADDEVDELHGDIFQFDDSEEVELFKRVSLTESFRKLVQRGFGMNSPSMASKSSKHHSDPGSSFSSSGMSSNISYPVPTHPIDTILAELTEPSQSEGSCASVCSKDQISGIVGNEEDLQVEKEVKEIGQQQQEQQALDVLVEVTKSLQLNESNPNGSLEKQKTKELNESNPSGSLEKQKTKELNESNPSGSLEKQETKADVEMKSEEVVSGINSEEIVREDKPIVADVQELPEEEPDVCKVTFGPEVIIEENEDGEENEEHQTYL